MVGQWQRSKERLTISSNHPNRKEVLVIDPDQFLVTEIVPEDISKLPVSKVLHEKEVVVILKMSKLWLSLLIVGHQ